MFDQVSDHLVVQSGWHKKLTIACAFSEASRGKVASRKFLNASNSRPLHFKIIFDEIRELTSFNYFADTFLK